MDAKDNKHLLMDVLKEHFKNRYTLVENAFTDIEEYSKNPSMNTYKQTLNKLYGLMNGDLPPKILLYFLTMVPLPEINDSKPGDVFVMMKKTHESLPKTMRPILLNYLEEMSTANNFQTKIEIHPYQNEVNNNNNSLLEDYNCNKLVDICARFIFTNMEDLKKMYQEKNSLVWKLIYNCENNHVLQQYYTMVEYLNKQRKILRMIEDHEIPLDIFQEEYGNSEVFLKKNHKVMKALSNNLLEEESDVLVDAIARFYDRC